MPRKTSGFPRHRLLFRKTNSLLYADEFVLRKYPFLFQHPSAFCRRHAPMGQGKPLIRLAPPGGMASYIILNEPSFGRVINKIPTVIKS